MRSWRIVAAGGVVVLALVVVLVTFGGDDPPGPEDLLVTGEDLRELEAGEDVLLLDAREAEDYEQGAIPGAVSLPTEALNRTVTLDDGTEVPRIVQEAEDIVEPLQSAGVASDLPVVVYDNGAETSATRIFWVLDYYGHERVSVLDGGIAAWEAAGGELSTAEVEADRGDFTPEAVESRHADYDYVQEAMFSDSVVLCNGLSGESYEDGSIEGSTNLHATSLFDDGDVPHFRADDALEQMLTDAGYEDGQEFLSFCGSGYMASINYFAGRLLGLEQVRMYDGSLVDWEARGGTLLPSGGDA